MKKLQFEFLRNKKCPLFTGLDSVHVDCLTPQIFCGFDLFVCFLGYLSN